MTAEATSSENPGAAAPAAQDGSPASEPLGARLAYEAVAQAAAIAVQDADPFVRQHAHWQTPSRGGYGAARDVCELLLEARGQLGTLRDRYL